MKNKIEIAAAISLLIFLIFGGFVFFVDTCCGPKEVSVTIMRQSEARYKDLHQVNPFH